MRYTKEETAIIEKTARKDHQKYNLSLKDCIKYLKKFYRQLREQME